MARFVRHTAALACTRGLLSVNRDTSGSTPPFSTTSLTRGDASLNYSLLQISHQSITTPTKLHYTTLHYTTLHHYATLHHTTLHRTTLHHYTTLCHATPHHTTPLHYTTLHYTMPRYTTPHHTTTLHYTALHITSHHTAARYNGLHSTTPHYSTLLLHYTTPTHITSRRRYYTLQCTTPLLYNTTHVSDAIAYCITLPHKHNTTQNTTQHDLYFTSLCLYLQLVLLEVVMLASASDEASRTSGVSLFSRPIKG